MRIRDLGDWVEFWVITDRATYNHDQTYSYQVNGVDSPTIKFDMNARGSWQLVDRVVPNGRQYIRFTMFNSGIGFPTYDFWQFIERARVPDPPRAPYFFEVTDTQIHSAFDYNYDGGMPIDQAEIWYSDDPNVPKWVLGNTRDGWANGLRPRTWYYFWGKVHNAIGWSALSARAQQITDGIPDAPNPPAITNVAATTVHGAFSFTQWSGGTPIRDQVIAYGTDPNKPQLFVHSMNSDITGLQSNQTYYFWSQVKNDIGWGFLSSRVVVKTLGPPAAPSSVDLNTPTATTVKASFAPNADNGRPIDSYQIGYGKTPNGPDAYFDLGASPSGVVTGLEPGVLYYFWGRAHNAYGWGAISANAKTTQTTAGAWINVNGVWKQAVPFVNVNGVWQPAAVWAKIAGVWKETT